MNGSREVKPEENRTLGRLGRAGQDWVAAALLVVSLGACGGEHGQTGGDAGTSGAPAVTLGFDDGTERRVRAGTPVDLALTVEPPGIYDVAFSLLVACSGQGQACNFAFLDAGLRTTDADGRTSVSLRVVSPGQFRVRAVVGRASTELVVSAEELDTGTLLVTPNYGGTRLIDTWIASVHVGRQCSDVGDPLTAASGYQREQAAGGALRLANVPAERRLAVTLRAGRFASGCRDIDVLRADSTIETSVEVFDRPLQLSALDLELSMNLDDLDPLQEPLASWIEGQARLLLGVPEALSDAEALVRAIAGQETASGLLEQSHAPLLVPALETLLGAAEANSGLRTRLRDWMRAAVLALHEPGSVGINVSGGRTDPADATTLPAELAITRVGALGADAAGLPDSTAGLLTADASDRLRLGATLVPWRFARLLRSGADLASGPGGVPGAWAQAWRCDAVASALGATSETGEIVPGCNNQCAEQLCSQALQTLWRTVTDGEEPEFGWQWSASGPAQINSVARPTSAAGTWIGTLTSPSAVTDANVTSVVPIGGVFEVHAL